MNTFEQLTSPFLFATWIFWNVLHNIAKGPASEEAGYSNSLSLPQLL